MKITFDSLPEAVGIILQKVESIEHLYLEQVEIQTQQPQDEILTLVQAAEFLNLAVSTIYGLVHRKAIPYMKRGKKIYFYRHELVAYLNEGKRLSLDQLKEERKNLNFNKKG